MKPAKEVALNKSPISRKIKLLAGKSAWNKIKKNKDMTIVNETFEISSVKDLFINLYVFKNSIGKNNKNKEAKNKIKAQNKLSPDQFVILKLA